MKKQVLFTLLATALVGSAFADGADGQWRGNLGASFSANSGTSKNEALLLNADGARTTADDKISAGAYINQGKSTIAGTSTTTANKAGARAQYDYNLSSQMYGYGKLAFDTDRVNSLDLRSQLGAGVGYHVIKAPDMTFDVMGGVGAVKNTYTQVETIGSTTGTSFNSVGLELGEESTHKISDTVSFKQRLDFAPGLTGIKSDLVKFNAQLNVSMSKTLSLNVGVMDTYNSKTPVGIAKNDLGIFTGLSLKLGS